MSYFFNFLFLKISNSLFSQAVTIAFFVLTDVGRHMALIVWELFWFVFCFNPRNSICFHFYLLLVIRFHLVLRLKPQVSFFFPMLSHLLSWSHLCMGMATRRVENREYIPVRPPHPHSHPRPPSPPRSPLRGKNFLLSSTPAGIFSR